jgi:hypothetical protein
MGHLADKERAAGYAGAFRLGICGSALPADLFDEPDQLFDFGRQWLLACEFELLEVRILADRISMPSPNTSLSLPPNAASIWFLEPISFTSSATSRFSQNPPSSLTLSRQPSSLALSSRAMTFQNLGGERACGELLSARITCIIFENHSLIFEPRHAIMKNEPTSPSSEIKSNLTSSPGSSAMTRRDFLGAVTLASAALTSGAALGALPDGETASPGKARLQSFDYVGVKLRPSRWQRQYADARDFYLGVSNDDILHGFRAGAGLPAPGKTLGGWASRDTYEIFGQWLMAMARAALANDDQALRDKASLLVTEWGKTIDKNFNFGRPYAFEKMVGGLVDMHLYAGQPEALDLLERITDYAITNLNRARIPAQNLTVKLTQGDPLEWYTLSENLYRAYQHTGKQKYRDFADVWLYPQYWEKFLTSANPQDVRGFHAYSHLNTLSSAAMAYAVSGDPKYLQIMRHAYDFFQNVQCYATGGYGPAEKLVPDDGALGDSLEVRIDNFETPCGSWAGIKLSKYLLLFTGEARYGDWIETLLYNGIGAALPITTGGRNFYYSNYALGSALKAYDQSTFTCCSGTYFQNVAEYSNLIYFREGNGLCINLYLPSEVTWQAGGVQVELVQETRYPEAETVSLSLKLNGTASFPLKFRVPHWASDVTVKMNGAAQPLAAQPGSWAVVDRSWQNGDIVEIHSPLKLRRVPVDQAHPDRVAVMHGSVVLAQEAAHDPLPAIPKTNEALVPYFKPAGDRPGVFFAQDNLPARGAFRPFYTFGEGERYHIYFDPKLRRELW